MDGLLIDKLHKCVYKEKDMRVKEQFLNSISNDDI